ncbi:hypothetical protein LCGC14_1164720 [marine sediment metagenome]|uniref:Uncharacterized protein n=1 Tax=marine sediment metagenome TaxID=412755 RepID=A0A0F9PX71_9ZZZZ
MNKHLIWAISLLLVVGIICGTLIWINYNSWTLRFEMDDNTKEAIESVEYPIVSNEPLPQFEFCSIPSKWFDEEGHGFTFKQVNGTCYWFDHAENTWRVMR